MEPGTGFHVRRPTKKIKFMKESVGKDALNESVTSLAVTR
jgi:hypothetical protein